MLNPAYSIQKFSENFSKITKINEVIELVKTQTFDLEIDLVHRIPSTLIWRPSDNSFSGEYNLLVYPRITVDGKSFSPPKMVAVQAPSEIWNCESAFLYALKQAISDVQQVWN